MLLFYNILDPIQIQINLLKTRLKSSSTQNPAFSKNGLELSETQEQSLINLGQPVLATVLSDPPLLTHLTSQPPHGSVVLLFPLER